MISEEKDKNNCFFRKPFHFFEVVSNTLFIATTGVFATLILIFIPISVLFFSPIYNQIILFSLIGCLVVTISYKLFLRYNSHYLRNLNYEIFVVAKKKLLLWFLWTMNSYFLICWFVLIILGATDGFGLKFPTQDNTFALVSDPDKTKALGLILMFVQVFLLIIFKIIFYYWNNILSFAYREFERRRRTLEIVRSKAGLSK